jgi:hypothetical protein
MTKMNALLRIIHLFRKRITKQFSYRYQWVRSGTKLLLEQVCRAAVASQRSSLLIGRAGSTCRSSNKGFELGKRPKTSSGRPP